MKRLSLLLIPAAVALLVSCGPKGGKSGADAGKGTPAGASAPTEQADRVKAEFGLELVQGTICADVQNMKPVDEKTAFTGTSAGKVYTFTAFAGDKAQTITHRYMKRVEVQSGAPDFYVPHFSKELKIGAAKAYGTWSYVTDEPGDFRVDVLAPDGQTVIKMLAYTVSGGEKTAFLADDGGLVLDKAVLTPAIDKGKPGAETTAFTAKGDTAPVYVWLSFSKANAPTKAFLKWYRQVTDLGGRKDYQVVATSSVDVKAATWVTWNGVNAEAGAGRLEVLSADGKKVLSSLDFTVSK